MTRERRWYRRLNATRSRSAQRAEVPHTRTVLCIWWLSRICRVTARDTVAKKDDFNETSRQARNLGFKKLVNETSKMRTMGILYGPRIDRDDRAQMTFGPFQMV